MKGFASLVLGSESRGPAAGIEVRILSILDKGWNWSVLFEERLTDEGSADSYYQAAIDARVAWMARTRKMVKL